MQNCIILTALEADEKTLSYSILNLSVELLIMTKSCLPGFENNKTTSARQLQLLKQWQLSLRWPIISAAALVCFGFFALEVTFMLLLLPDIHSVEAVAAVSAAG